jgi:hypothetical protein
MCGGGKGQDSFCVNNKSNWFKIKAKWFNLHMLQPSFNSTLVLQCKVQDYKKNSSKFQHLAIMIPLHY